MRCGTSAAGWHWCPAAYLLHAAAEVGIWHEQHIAHARGCDKPAAAVSGVPQRVQAALQAREFHNWRRLKALESEIAALKAGQSPFALPLQALEKCFTRFPKSDAPN